MVTILFNKIKFPFWLKIYTWMLVFSHKGEWTGITSFWINIISENTSILFFSYIEM